MESYKATFDINFESRRYETGGGYNRINGIQDKERLSH